MAEIVERWLDVPGFEGIYQASDQGRTKRLARHVNSKNGSTALRREHIYQPRPNGATGYQELHWTDASGARVRTSVHVVVCRTFHGEPPTPHHQVAHGDGDRNNNRECNLRWATAKENAADRAAHGKELWGERQWKTTLTEQDVLAIRSDYRGGYGDLARIARNYAVTNGCIYRIVRRINWKHI